MNIEIKVLELLEQNPKLSAEEIAIMLNEKKEEIEKVIKKLEDEKVIVKYHTIVNWEKTEKEVVEAIIEVKVTPQRGVGYDAIAKGYTNFQRSRQFTFFLEIMTYM